MPVLPPLLVWLMVVVLDVVVVTCAGSLSLKFLPLQLERPRTLFTGGRQPLLDLTPRLLVLCPAGQEEHLELPNVSA